MTAADNARRKLSSKDQILAVDATGKPYPKNSLFCLSVNNPLRQATIRTIRWPGSSMIDATPASSPRSSLLSKWCLSGSEGGGAKRLLQEQQEQQPGGRSAAENDGGELAGRGDE